MKKKHNRKYGRVLAAGALAAVLAALQPQMPVQAAENVSGAVYVQMPGFVVEQWGMPQLLTVDKLAYVRELPDKSLSGFGTITKGQTYNVWGQTDTGWYFIEFNGRLGYVRCEAGPLLSQAEAAALVQQQAQAAALIQQQAQIAAQAAAAPAVAAGIVFIGDSRMVTLKEAVEKNLGVCPAAVVAQSGSRYEWFHDSGIPQADRIIGKGSRVVINMGVNDLADADKYAKDVNYWAAVWSARGATVYYASVNPVYANSYGLTEERVGLFNSRLSSQLIPQVIWLDSNTYLKQTGVHATDGLHYKEDTNLVLFNYYMTMIGA